MQKLGRWARKHEAAMNAEEENKAANQWQAAHNNTSRYYKCKIYNWGEIYKSIAVVNDAL